SRLFLLIVLSFLISLIGLTYTTDLNQGWLDLERSAFLVAFLVIFYNLRKLNVSAFKLIVAFAVGTFVILGYGMAYTVIALPGIQQKQVLELGHSYFTDLILVHPSYL